MDTQRFAENIIGFARDPRADGLMVAGLAMTSLEDAGDDSWRGLNRTSLLKSAELDEEAYLEILERATPARKFEFELFLGSLNSLPPIEAGIVATVLYFDLRSDGEHDLGHLVMDAIRRRLREHMKAH